jgi:2-keto-3-deoxy-L-fuconate dehydrogenase
VLATDIAEDKVADLAEAFVATRRLDVTDREAIAALADELPPVDILFNCAGSCTTARSSTCCRRLGFLVRASTCKSMYPDDPRLPAEDAGARAARSRAACSIINMASTASSVKGVPNRCAYGATKAAVIGLTKAVAADFISQGIRCNAICPGTVATPSLDDRIAMLGVLMTGGTEAARQAFVERQPMGRLGTPEEVAALAIYLASDESSFTTGAIHIIDGGFTL